MHKNRISFSFLNKPLAYLIAAVMLLSLSSVTAFAETADEEIVQTKDIEEDVITDGTGTAGDVDIISQNGDARDVDIILRNGDFQDVDVISQNEGIDVDSMDAALQIGDIYKVTIKDKAGDQQAGLMVTATDPVTSAQRILKSGNTVGDGETVEASAANAGSLMLKLSAARGDGTLIDTVYIAPETTNKITIPSVNSDVKFTLSGTRAPLKSVAKLTVLKTTYPYTGEAIYPEIEVKATFGENEIILKEGVDYTVSCTNNTDSGTASVKVTGIGLYRGSLSGKFKIKAKKVSLKGAVIEEIPDYRYYGSAIEPGVYVTLNGRDLYEGKDYKVKYRSNKMPGVARVVVTGIGNYTGTIKASFNILYAENPAPSENPRTYDKDTGMITTAAKLAKADQVFTPLKIENAKGKVTYMVVFGDSRITVNKTTGKVTLKKGTGKGTYQIRLMVRVAGDEYYKEKARCYNIKIVVK